MLEQAIADAAALREQAIKNAEQSVLDKYSKQIKEAVDQMLEVDEPDVASKVDEIINEAEEELMQEEEMATAPIGGGETEFVAPSAWDERAADLDVRITAMLDKLPVDADGMVELDLGELSLEQDEEDASNGFSDAPLGDLGGLGDTAPSMDLGGDLGSDLPAEPSIDDMDLQLQEVLEMLQEEEEESEEVVEEQMTIDMDEDLAGWITSGKDPNHKYQRERGEVNNFYSEEESEEESSEDNSADAEQAKLYETLETLTRQNEQLESVLTKMEEYLEETLLSNAKLLYQNRTLSDASLNERQKTKIVEAIANAESPKEAKKLHETLKATVGSTPNSNKGPQSLSESVNRRSNLSAMLNSRQNINESKSSNDPFMEKMQKLAGIKK